MITVNLSRNELQKALIHIRKNIKARKNINIEIYDDIILFVCKNIEIPVPIIKPQETKHTLLANYTLIDYKVLLKILERFPEAQFFEFTFYKDRLDVCINSCKISINLIDNDI